MQTKSFITILSVIICISFTSINAQVKIKLLTDADKEQLKTANSIEEAMENPDSVQALFINYAKLNVIPQEVEKCKNLIVLGLGGNNIKEIPPFIFNLTNLQELGLSWNHISTIPEEISSLKKLTSISIWGSNITEVPEDLLELPNIQKIGLKGNPIPKEEIKRLRKAYPNIMFEF